MKSAPTIVLELRPSAALRLGLATVVALALLAIPLSGAPLAVGVLLAVVALGLGLRADTPLRAARGTRMVLAPAGTWQIESAAGAVHAQELTHSAEVGPLMALTFGSRRDARYLVLLPDSCDRGDLRRLRVWLRQGHGGAQKPLAIE